MKNSNVPQIYTTPFRTYHQVGQPLTGRIVNRDHIVHLSRGSGKSSHMHNLQEKMMNMYCDGLVDGQGVVIASASGSKSRPLFFDLDFAKLETTLMANHIVMPEVHKVNLPDMFKDMEEEMQERDIRREHTMQVLNFANLYRPDPFPVLKLGVVDLMSEEQIKTEYELIQKKESKLSANERRRVVSRWNNMR